MHICHKSNPSTLFLYTDYRTFIPNNNYSGIFLLPPQAADEGRKRSQEVPQTSRLALRPGHTVPQTASVSPGTPRYSKEIHPREEGRKRGPLALRPRDTVPRHPL